MILGMVDVETGNSEDWAQFAFELCRGLWEFSLALRRAIRLQVLICYCGSAVNLAPEVCSEGSYSGLRSIFYPKHFP